MSARATIVVPLLRQNDAWLDQAVRSAVLQAAPCEVIVVTSRETPPSNRDLLSGLASRHSNLRVLFRDQPRGFPGTINFGIRAASTDRIGFLLSDDWLEPECVAECVALDADIVSTSHASFYADGVTPVGTRVLREAGFHACSSARTKASYLTYFFLFQKHALERAGYLDESIGDFPGIDDFHLIWTMLEQGASVSLVEKCLYNIRDHEGERLTLADPIEAARNLEKILRKHHIPEAEIPLLLARHSRWFGRPVHAVLNESASKGSGDVL